MDYQSNSEKSKKKQEQPEKNLEKIVQGDVIVRKRGMGFKIKSFFAEADIGSVTRYVVAEVLVPAARNMFFDTVTKGTERMLYGDRAQQFRHGIGGPSRMIYGGSPLGFPRTDYRSASTRPPSQLGMVQPRTGQNDFILPTKEEAMSVLQAMHDIVEKFYSVSKADLHELVGVPSTPVDVVWGWTDLSGSGVRPLREGFLIELPPMVPIPA